MKLAASIREFGFTLPVLIDDGGTIMAGEARVAAAIRLCMTEGPVIVAHSWGAAQIRAYRFANNRLAGHAT